MNNQTEYLFEIEKRDAAKLYSVVSYRYGVIWMFTEFFNKIGKKIFETCLFLSFIIEENAYYSNIYRTNP